MRAFEAMHKCMGSALFSHKPDLLVYNGVFEDFLHFLIIFVIGYRASRVVSVASHSYESEQSNRTGFNTSYGFRHVEQETREEEAGKIEGQNSGPGEIGLDNYSNHM